MGISRQQIFDLIWSEPMRSVAARYDVSGSFLTRVCRRLNIPRPPMGYWAKAAVGKAPDRPSLPPPRPGDEIEWCRDGEARRLPGELPKPPDSDRRKRSRRVRSAGSALLAGAREHLLAGKESEHGYLRPSKRRIADVYVSRATLDRALAFAADLFAALERRGYPVRIPGFEQRYSRPDLDERAKPGGSRYVRGAWNGPDRPTVVFVGAVPFSLTIYELSEKVEMRCVGGRYVRADRIPEAKSRTRESATAWVHHSDLPSGRLCLRATSADWRADWEFQSAESAPGRLPRGIRSIVRAIEDSAPAIASRIEEAERDAEIQRQRWRIERIDQERRALERRRVEAVEASRKHLLAIIESWGAAVRVNTFFEDLGRQINGLAPDERDSLLGRLTLARELLGSVEPLDHFRAWLTPTDRTDRTR